MRFMIHAMVTRLHSPRALSRPRLENWLNPSTDLMMPDTGSGVFSRCAILSTGVGYSVRFDQPKLTGPDGLLVH